MSDFIEQYDPYLLQLARQLDPGEWWERGPVGYVASMMDTRSYEERVDQIVTIAERLVTWIAKSINSDEPVARVLEQAIEAEIELVAGPLQQKISTMEDELDDLRSFAALHQDNPAPETDAEGFMIFDEEEPGPDMDNPLVVDIVRAGPLPPLPRTDVLKSTGPVAGAVPKPVAAAPITDDPEHGSLWWLAQALRKSQYTAESLGFDITASVSMYQGEDRNDVLATMDVTTEGGFLTSHRVWVTPEKAPEKHGQVYDMVSAAAKDVGNDLLNMLK